MRILLRKKSHLLHYYCVCVCLVLHSSRLLGSPFAEVGIRKSRPQAIPKALVIIHLRGSTWGDLFRGGGVPS